MSTVIADEMAAVAAALGALGVPATSNPGRVWVLAAQSETAALLKWPEGVSLSFGQDKLRFTLPVQLCSRGPDLDAQPRLLGVLPAVLAVLRPADGAQPDQIVQGDAVMPAYLIESPRIIGC